MVDVVSLLCSALIEEVVVRSSRLIIDADISSSFVAQDFDDEMEIFPGEFRGDRLPFRCCSVDVVLLMFDSLVVTGALSVEAFVVEFPLCCFWICSSRFSCSCSSCCL